MGTAGRFHLRNHRERRLFLGFKKPRKARKNTKIKPQNTLSTLKCLAAGPFITKAFMMKQDVDYELMQTAPAAAAVVKALRATEKGVENTNRMI